MRILFAAPRSAWVRYNLLQTLQAMGHEVVVWDWTGGWPTMAPGWETRRQRFGASLAAFARRQQRQRPFDLVFCYLYSTVVDPATVQELRSLGAPVVNFSCNNVHQFDLVSEIAPHFDLCVVPERSALEAYHSVGARPLHLGMAANPAFYRPYPVWPEYDVTFVGQRYADRADYVVRLRRAGIDVRVWGAGWRRDFAVRGAVAATLSVIEDEGLSALATAAMARLGRFWRRGSSDKHEPVSAAVHIDPHADELRACAGHRLLQKDMVALFSRSRISLGFATVGESHRAGQRLTQVRLRDFEAPMSGAFYITEDQPELHEYFEPGREVETYAGPDELVDKVRFYLGHPDAAASIRRAGRARALAEHTWEHRFTALFRHLGLSTSVRISP